MPSGNNRNSFLVGLRLRHFRDANQMSKKDGVLFLVVDGEIEALKNEAVYHKFDTAHYAKGMPKKGTQPEKHIFFNNPKIKAGYGKPEWGAKPGKLYFVITRDK